jgi:hypothetical protein
MKYYQKPLLYQIFKTFSVNVFMKKSFKSQKGVSN